MIFTMPETLYPRKNLVHRDSYPPVNWTDKMWVFRRRHAGKITFMSFLRPLRMALYPTIFLSALLAGTVHMFAAVGTTLIIPTYFPAVYGFNIAQSGNVALSLIIGAIIGEFFSGAWSDWIMTKKAARYGGERVPEYRIDALWPALILCPGGLLIFGLCLYKGVAWIGACIGLGVAIAGYQIMITVTTTYAIDGYRSQSGAISTLFNCVRQTLAFTIPFYNMPFAARAGYAWTFGTYALITVIMSIPVIMFRWYGRQLRNSMRAPAFDNDL